LGSWRKRCFIRHENPQDALRQAQNAQKGQKNGQKSAYKHINSWIPAPCLRLAGAGYDMQGFGLGQAAEDRNGF